jgi:hypothetical protein
MRKVLLYGNSLVMSTIGASLQECGDLELIHVDAGPDHPAGLADAAAQLGAREPVTIVFDRATTRLDFAMALLDEHPQVLLIGVDPETHQALVWCGRQASAVVAADLVEVITGGNVGGSRPEWRSADRRAQEVSASRHDPNQGG